MKWIAATLAAMPAMGTRGQGVGSDNRQAMICRGTRRRYGIIMDMAARAIELRDMRGN